ncbi:MAG: hypothetical protein JWP96_1423 [Polaromonas sp.]|nr:hypothetical protein [Polaromonas sp.]
MFEARQKRFTFDDDHFFFDLVFYNHLLRCYVLIDLKIGKLTHQDLGQMQMYVSYFDRYVKTNAESATIGIVVPRKSTRRWLKSLFPKTRISMRGNTSFICRVRRSCSRNWQSGLETYLTE